MLLGLSGKKPNDWLLAQLGCAIPCLVLSSLAYAKTCYRPNAEFHVWDRLGWTAHSLGFIMIYNAMALLFYTSGHKAVAWLFIIVTAASFIAYSIIDIVQKKNRTAEKASKLGFYALLLAAGAVVPMLSGLV